MRVLENMIAEAKKPPKPKTPPPEPKEEKGGKGKKGKVRPHTLVETTMSLACAQGPASPAGKRRGKTPPKKAVPEPPPESPKPVMTADEIMSKQRKIQMCKEYKEAVQIEGIQLALHHVRTAESS